MKQKLGIQLKTLLPLLAILVITMSGLALYNYYSQVSLLDREAEDALMSTIHSAQSIIAERLKQYQQMATLVAGMPSVQEAFAKGNRKKLTAEFGGAYETLKHDYKLAQFVFHTPPATAFLRVHQTEKYGDDVSSMRPMLVTVNEKRIPSRGIEIGRGGIGLRGTVPVFHKGRHIGSVEFGGDLAPAIDEAKQVFNVDAAVMLSQEATVNVWPEWQKNAIPIGNQIVFYATNPQLTQFLVTPGTLANAKAEPTEIYTESGNYAGRAYYIAMSPLKDYFGRGIGYVCVFKDRTELVNKITRVLFINVGIYLGILIVVAAAINYSLKKSVINRLVWLTERSDSVSMGNLTEPIELETKDEIATLAKSIDRMRVSMKKLLS